MLYPAELQALTKDILGLQPFWRRLTPFPGIRWIGTKVERENGGLILNVVAVWEH